MIIKQNSNLKHESIFAFVLTINRYQNRLLNLMAKNNFQTWDLLFDLPALRATLDELPRYNYPAAALAALCARYELSEQQLADIRRVYSQLRGHKPVSSWEYVAPGRSGVELLGSLPKLRKLLEGERDAPELSAMILRLRRERFHLTRAEMVRVLEAHAQPPALAQYQLAAPAGRLRSGSAHF